jgi:AcrR family transcriptional regulator
MMAQPLPARPKVEARRKQILDAAIDCVRRSGFHGASMAEIAAAAGVSVGQIYRYFENKEAIVAAIVAKDLAEMQVKFTDMETSSPAALLETLVSGCSHAIDRSYDPDRSALMLEILAEAARNPRVQAVVEQGDAAERDVIRTLFLRVLPSRLDDREVRARIDVLSMMFDGMVMRSVSDPHGDRVAICEVFSAAMRHLLIAPPFSAPFSHSMTNQ